MHSEIVLNIIIKFVINIKRVIEFIENIRNHVDSTNYEELEDLKEYSAYFITFHIKQENLFEYPIQRKFVRTRQKNCFNFG